MRWYAMHSTVTGEASATRYLSPLSGEPVIFDAPDREEAQAHAERCWPTLHLKARSVVEYDAIQRIDSAKARAVAKYDNDTDIALARDHAERSESTGQGDLLADPVAWYRKRVQLGMVA